MDFEKLAEGNFLEIKGIKYEIVKAVYDYSRLPPDYKLRKLVHLELLKEGVNSLFPTDALGYFLDNGEISFSGGKIDEKDVDLVA